MVTFNGGLSTNTIFNVSGIFTIPNTGTDTLSTTENVSDLSSNESVGVRKNFTSISPLDTTSDIHGGQVFQVILLSCSYSTASPNEVRG